MPALEVWGLPGLFLAAFLAGSIVPAPSEGVLAALVYAGVPIARAVAVATVGNVLGATSLWGLGRWAASGRHSPFAGWLERRVRAAGQRLERARGAVARFGPLVLLLSWVPVIGDLAVLAAGLVGVRAVPFVVFTALGKGLRYVAVAAVANAAATATHG